MPVKPRSVQTGNPRLSERVGDGLALAAAPAFAVMACLAWSGHAGHGHMNAGAAPSGMTLMYLLMSLFHLAPWLRLPHRGLGQAR